MKLEAVAEKISTMSPEAQSAYFQEIKKNHRLYNAELKDIENNIALIDRQKLPATDECNKRTGTIMTTSAILSALAAGSVCAATSTPIPGEQLLSAITGAFTGGVVGGITLGACASLVDDVYLTMKRRLLEKRQYKIRQKIYEDNYIVNKAWAKDAPTEEML